MAWGLWNKIKQGFKKVGGAIKKAASFVNDKVIKPFKPVISKVADTFLPGSGRIVEAVSDGIDEFAQGNFRNGAQKMIRAEPSGNFVPVGLPNSDRPYRRLNR